MKQNIFYFFIALLCVCFSACAQKKEEAKQEKAVSQAKGVVVDTQGKTPGKTESAAPTPKAESGKKIIKTGSTVKMDYTLTVDGQVADTSEGRGPLSYIQGEHKIIVGLEKQLEGLTVGDEKTVTVAPQEAYGDYDPLGLKEVPRSRFSPDIDLKPGVILQAAAPSGERFPARITEVRKDSVVVDFNHPLAGKTLTFKIKIVDIQ